MLSGTLSTSSSSLMVEQKPALVTSNLTHTSCEMLRQVPPVGHCPLEVQTFATLLHVPVIGQPPAPVSLVQTMELDRLQFPEPSVTFCAPWQSPSHASPTPSPSLSSWVGLVTVGQLSHSVPKPSASPTHVPVPHTVEDKQGLPGVVPPTQAPFSWPGLYTWGQLSVPRGGGAMLSPSTL